MYYFIPAPYVEFYYRIFMMHGRDPRLPWRALAAPVSHSEVDIITYREEVGQVLNYFKPMSYWMKLPES